MTTDLTTRDGQVEHDQHLAGLYGKIDKAQDRLDRATKMMRYKVPGGFDKPLVMVIGYIKDRLNEDKMQPWVREGLTKALNEYQTALFAHREAEQDAEAFDAVFTYWSRFFLVAADHGHIHRSMRCHTCRPTTRFAWLPHLSGLTEEDAVADQGPRLCTVCFPTAPVEWTVGIKDERPSCPGKGQYVQPAARKGRRGACPTCGYWGALTQYGYIRKHQPKEGN